MDVLDADFDYQKGAKLTAQIAKDFPEQSKPYVDIAVGEEILGMKLTEKHIAMLDAMRDRFDIFYPLVAATYVSDMESILPENPEEVTPFDSKDLRFRMWLGNILNAISLIMAHHYVSNKEAVIESYIAYSRKNGKDIPLENVPKEFIFMHAVLKTIEININSLLIRFQDFNMAEKKKQK